MNTEQPYLMYPFIFLAFDLFNYNHVYSSGFFIITSK